MFDYRKRTCRRSNFHITLAYDRVYWKSSFKKHKKKIKIDFKHLLLLCLSICCHCFSLLSLLLLLFSFLTSITFDGQTKYTKLLLTCLLSSAGISNFFCIFYWHFQHFVVITQTTATTKHEVRKVRYKTKIFFSENQIELINRLYGQA